VRSKQSGNPLGVIPVTGDVPNGGNAMLRKYLLSGAVLTALALPASAQMAAEFYVVQDTSTKKCTIVDKKPTTTTTVVVGDGVFKTRTEAETGMKTIKVCTTN
jgi:uncharacterized membrane protein